MKKKLISAHSNLKKYFTGNPEVESLLSQIKVHIDNIEDAQTTILSDGFALPELFAGDYVLFSDGACRGNPGPGSWGFMVQNRNGEVVAEGSGINDHTTNNKMEMDGAIAAIDSVLESNPLSNSLNLSIYTDSKYIVDGMKSWVLGWKKRGWKKADKKPPENLERWKKLDSYKSMFNQLEFFWVKGHSGHPQNEYCDQLCNKILDENGY